jgi:flavin-dependent dehydrogenase
MHGRLRRRAQPDEMPVPVPTTATCNVKHRRELPQDLTRGGADGQVTGVVLEGGERLAADLVVDASGRGDHSDRWLAALGYPAPQPEEVEIGLGYVSRFYRRAPGDLPVSAALVQPALPAGDRRLFQNLTDVPGGYLAIGDAICSVSPLHGRGTAIAAQQARVLGQVLDRHGPASAGAVRDFYRQAAGITSGPWRTPGGLDCPDQSSAASAAAMS